MERGREGERERGRGERERGGERERDGEREREEDSYREEVGTIIQKSRNWLARQRISNTNISLDKERCNTSDDATVL